MDKDESHSTSHSLEVRSVNYLPGACYASPVWFDFFSRFNDVAVVEQSHAIDNTSAFDADRDFAIRLDATRFCSASLQTYPLPSQPPKQGASQQLKSESGSETVSDC
jgi:hypothetical protein